MVEHCDLIAEMGILEQLPAQERLKLAHKRRLQQIRKWMEFDECVDPEPSHLSPHARPRGGQTCDVRDHVTKLNGDMEKLDSASVLSSSGDGVLADHHLLRPASASSELISSPCPKSKLRKNSPGTRETPGRHKNGIIHTTPHQLPYGANEKGCGNNYHKNFYYFQNDDEVVDPDDRPLDEMYQNEPANHSWYGREGDDVGDDVPSITTTTYNSLLGVNGRNLNYPIGCRMDQSHPTYVEQENQSSNGKDNLSAAAARSPKSKLNAQNNPPTDNHQNDHGDDPESHLTDTTELTAIDNFYDHSTGSCPIDKSIFDARGPNDSDFEFVNSIPSQSQESSINFKSRNGQVTSSNNLRSEKHETSKTQFKRTTTKEGKHDHSYNKKLTKFSRRVKFNPGIILLEAASRNDLNEVRELLKSGFDPNVSNADGLTALHQCCIDDYYEMVELLLDHGADINACDTELWSPLHAAATCGHANLIKLFADRGANLLALNADGNMPYDMCEDEVALDVLETEMSNRGITQEDIDEARMVPEKNMLEDLKQAKENGQNFDQRDSKGATPLHVACANGYSAVVEYLLDNSAYVNCEDNDLWTPLHAAAFWCHASVIENLIRKGADIEAKNKDGETPIEICEDPEIKDRLLDIKTEMEHKIQHNQNAWLNPNQPSRISNRRNSSIRRSSIRDKTALSRREIIEEAKLRHLTPHKIESNGDTSGKTNNINNKDIANNHEPGLCDQHQDINGDNNNTDRTNETHSSANINSILKKVNPVLPAPNISGVNKNLSLIDENDADTTSQLTTQNYQSSFGTSTFGGILETRALSELKKARKLATEEKLKSSELNGRCLPLSNENHLPKKDAITTSKYPSGSIDLSLSARVVRRPTNMSVPKNENTDNERIKQSNENEDQVPILNLIVARDGVKEDMNSKNGQIPGNSDKNSHTIFSFNSKKSSRHTQQSRSQKDCCSIS